MDPSLAAFFEPASVAVLGASDDPSKVGGSVLANLRAGGFPGTIVPVNIRRTVVQGLPAVASIRDAPGPVDVLWIVPVTRTSAASTTPPMALAASAVVTGRAMGTVPNPSR